MSDDDDTKPQAAAPTQQFNIKKLYIKDVSFESPVAPELFANLANWNPHINMQINTETRALDDDIYEVVLSVTATATIEGKTAYLVEIKQAGLFLIKGFEKPLRDGLLGSHCPGALFPFVREAISGLVAKGGFPQLLLEPINFEAVYAQHLAKVRQNAPAPTTQQ
jgi:preprotein translocase subunit SecB